MSFKSPNLGEAAQSPDLLRQVLQSALDQSENESRKSDPIGGVIRFGGNVAPEGWLACNGTSYNRTRYPELAKALQDLHGTPTATTFAVPTIANANGCMYVVRAE